MEEKRNNMEMLSEEEIQALLGALSTGDLDYEDESMLKVGDYARLDKDPKSFKHGGEIGLIIYIDKQKNEAYMEFPGDRESFCYSTKYLVPIRKKVLSSCGEIKHVAEFKITYENKDILNIIFDTLSQNGYLYERSNSILDVYEYVKEEK